MILRCVDSAGRQAGREPREFTGKFNQSLRIRMKGIQPLLLRILIVTIINMYFTNASRLGKVKLEKFRVMDTSL